MSRKLVKPSYDQALQILRSHSFDVKPAKDVANGVLATKHGVGAVLVPGSTKDEPTAFAVHPGVLVRGEVARLLDRGYQKFIKSSQYELPATAAQLQAIHAFSEELKTLIGDVNLYNESLGTTSDLYQYDRLKGREAAQPAPARPWDAAGEMTDGH
jgi:hypothetical protein